MVAGLGFLSKKSFNPKNLSNQKTVWEARQQQQLDDKKARDREIQLQQEQEDAELARVRHGETGGDKATLKFMYAPPPGMAQDINEPSEDTTTAEKEDCKPPANSMNNNNNMNSLLQRQPGDDDAAAAFRAMLAGAAAQQEHDDTLEGTFSFSNSSGAALQGTTIERTFAPTDSRSALEKAVGKRDGGSAALTVEEQVARFPQLKHAPMAKGMSSTNVQVNFKPLGTQLRNVQCLSCGVWGHSRGDRECSKSGWDPFSSKVPVRSNVVPTTKRPDDSGRIAEEAPADVDRTSRRKRDYSSSSDSEDSEDRRERRRRKKERKKRKEKKRKHRRRSPSPEERRSSSRGGTKKSRRHNSDGSDSD